jgi:uncharacterized protein
MPDAAQTMIDPREVFSRYAQTINFEGLNFVGLDQIGILGDTLLHMCAHSGDADGLEVLLIAGANPNIRGDLGNTPLHDATASGNDSCVQLLLKWGADPTIANECGDLPAHSV